MVVVVTPPTAIMKDQVSGTAGASLLVLPGAYERRSREGACNYSLHLGAIQIQIISQLTAKYGNHSFNQASE